MKIDSDEYFSVAFPGFCCFIIGLFFFKTAIFKPEIYRIKRDVKKNETLLVLAVVVGVLLRLISSVFSQDFSFFFFLISGIRFVASFALCSFNGKRYWKLVALVLVVELYFAFISGMYHDALMWVIFFLLYFIYTNKPNLISRIVGLFFCVVLVFFVQALKGIYRGKINEIGSSSLGLVVETSSDVVKDINSEENLFSTLNRGNQAWILASTIDRMDRVGDFQGLNIVGIYLDAALLPRFLSPDKLKSGDKSIFNKFSGHVISDATSMGLGVFADGYISYGFLGVLIFGFGLGLIFNLCFMIIQYWSRISEFYILLVLPILNYAVRPDCDTQTIINHTVKGLIIYSILVSFTKYNFFVGSRVFNNLKNNRFQNNKFQKIKN